MNSNIDQLTGSAPLFHQYPGQLEPQDAYIEIHSDRVSFDWNAEIGTAIPVAVAHSRIHRVTIPHDITVEGCREILSEHHDLITSIQAGMGERWDGSNMVGTLTETATEALDAFTREIEHLQTQDYPRCYIVDADDWFSNESLDGTENPEQLHAASLANIPGEYTAIHIAGLDSYLESLRGEPV